VKTWGKQALQAVQCLHTAGLQHWDLKLGNVMLTQDLSTLRLMDFGLSKAIGPLTTNNYATLHAGGAHGTTEEQDNAPFNDFAGSGNAMVPDRMEDYACGILLIELAWGKTIQSMIVNGKTGL
jgi:serine/threonine protein kinase